MDNPLMVQEIVGFIIKTDGYFACQT